MTVEHPPPRDHRFFLEQRSGNPLLAYKHWLELHFSLWTESSIRVGTVQEDSADQPKIRLKANYVTLKITLVFVVRTTKFLPFQFSVFDT